MTLVYCYPGFGAKDATFVQRGPSPAVHTKMSLAEQNILRVIDCRNSALPPNNTRVLDLDPSTISPGSLSPIHDVHVMLDRLLNEKKIAAYARRGERHFWVKVNEEDWVSQHETNCTPRWVTTANPDLMTRQEAGERLMKAGEELGELDACLDAIICGLKEDTICLPDNFCSFPRVLKGLHAAADENLQLILIKKLIESDRYTLLSNVQPQAWYTMGRDMDIDERLAHLIFAHLSPQALVHLLNGIVERSLEASKAERLAASLFQYLIQPGKIDPSSLLLLSDAALTHFPVNGPIKGAENNLMWGLRAEEFLSYHFIKALQNPENPEEKRLLDTVTRSILGKPNPSMTHAIRSCLAALTSKQIDKLSWDQYPKWMALFFAYKNETLQSQEQSLLTMLYSLNSEESKMVYDLMDSFHFFNRAHKKGKRGRDDNPIDIMLMN